MDQNFKIKNIFIENRKSNLPFDFWVYSDILPILLTPTNKCIYIEYMYTYYHKVKLDSIPSSFISVTSDTETITIAIFTKYMQSPFLRYPPPFFFYSLKLWEDCSCITWNEICFSDTIVHVPGSFILHPCKQVHYQ